jgi:hypothetical protein
MKRLFLILTIGSLLAACTSAIDSPSANPDSPVSEPPISPNDLDFTILPVSPKTDNTIPRHGDDALLRENVYLDSIDLLTMESYPLQFSLALTGNLPTPCHQLRVAVAPPDDTNRILVDVYSLVAADGMCAEVLQPFTQNIPLGSFPAGRYTLWVNGELVAEFDA